MSQTLDFPELGPEARQNGKIRPQVVQDFSRASQSARDLAQLRGFLRDGVWALGFHHFLLQGAMGQVWLADLPSSWALAAAPSADPVLVTAAQSYAPFLWSDMSRLIALTASQSRFI